MTGSQRFTADATIGVSGRGVRVFTVNLVSGGTASTLTLRNGRDASATAYDQIDGVINQSVTKNYINGLRFPDGCFADADANISYSTIEFDNEF